MSAVDLPRRLHEYGGDVHLLRLAITKMDTHIGGLPSLTSILKAWPGISGQATKYGQEPIA